MKEDRSTSEDIELVIESERILEPASILFRTVFEIEDEIAYKMQLGILEIEMLSFFKSNGIEYKGPSLIFMDNNGFEYQYPSYQILIGHTEYQFVEEFLLAHSKISLGILEVFFSDIQKQDFVETIINEAKEKATLMAAAKDSTLQEKFEMERILPPVNNWSIGPPLGARVNQFQQKIKGRYKFCFKIDH